MTIDLTNALTILAVIITLIGALIKMIRTGDIKRFDALEKEFLELQKKHSDSTAEIKANKQLMDTTRDHFLSTERRMDDLTSKHFETLTSRLDDITEKIDAASNKLSASHDAQREALADVRETIAGFGSTYVSRKEYLHDKS